MAYPPLAASRRPRRRRATFVILVLLGLAVAVIFLAVRYRTERRDSVDYLAAAKEVSDRHANLAGSLAELFTNLGEMERPDILERLTDLSDESATTRVLLASETVTAAVGEANGFFLVALTSWDRALDALDDAVVEVIDGDPDGRAGDAMLAEAFDDLRVGDRAYDLFRDEVRRLDQDLVTWTYADFGYTADDRDVLYDSVVVAGHLRTTLRFVENLDVSIRATTDPEPLGADGGVRIVPDSESFSVQAVVTNEGNVAAELITVTLELAAAGSSSPEQRSEIVAILEPGEATTVQFADLPLEPGVAYELQVSAVVGDDDAPENNTWGLIFVRNAP
jgi:hypothetical protein